MDFDSDSTIKKFTGVYFNTKEQIELQQRRAKRMDWVRNSSTRSVIFQAFIDKLNQAKSRRETLGSYYERYTGYRKNIYKIIYVGFFNYLAKLDKNTCNEFISALFSPEYNLSEFKY